jgi:nifR3 family TIM-barrel protein
MKSFWDILPKPILALAPLHDVTDSAFRQIVARCGKPSVMFTEFTSVDGLMHEKSRERMLKRYLQFDESERPLVAQIWGTEPEKFRATAALLAELQFDGIDINMGCPVHKVVKACACGALINEPALAQDIVRATQEGSDLPVSVKTRLGYNTDVTESWIAALLETKPAALTLHGRTVREMSKVPAHWDRIAVAAEMAHEKGVLLLGNGDVRSRADALHKVEQYGVDGVMIGRGIFGNFWFFAPEGTVVTLADKLRMFAEHAELFEKSFTGIRTVVTLRKHVRGLAQGFPGAKELREELVQASTAAEIRDVVERYLAMHEGPLTERA